MQNFKTFLKESQETGEVIFNIQAFFKNDPDEIREQLMKIKDENIKVDYASQVEYVSFNFSMQEDFNVTTEHKIFNFLNSLGLTLDNTHGETVDVIGYPPYKASFGKINLYCIHKENGHDYELKSFSNIHKYLECDTLRIDGIRNLNCGVLSLLKIKGLKEIIMPSWCMKTDIAPAINIVAKHLKLDKDIVTCSEELIEKGFKEYAKL